MKSKAAARRKRSLLRSSVPWRVGLCGSWQRKGKEILAYDHSSDSLKQFFMVIQIPRNGDLSKHKEKLRGSGFAVG